jgi:L-amino acid N-acyltransferase YncA
LFGLILILATLTTRTMDTSLITLRDATEADLPAILEIYNDVLLTTTAVYSEAAHTLEMRQAWFNERSRVEK